MKQAVDRMEWIGFGNEHTGMGGNGFGRNGMEYTQWKAMDTFGVGGLPSCLDHNSVSNRRQ
jgi:hypothetical protein